jgi:transposase InsO family protein
MDQDLLRVYYDPSHPAGFSGASKLRETVSKRKKNKVDEWLQSQDTYTLHKPARKRFPRNQYVVYRINELWQCDLNDLRGIAKYNEGFNYILTVIDVFSKVLYARVLKSKTPTEMIAAFKSIFKESRVKPINLQSDKGTEFTGQKVKQFLTKNGVKYFTTRNPDVKAAVVERVNRTLKSRMWRYLTYKNTYKYIDVLPKLVSAYNNSKHRSIKMKPIEVNSENSFRVWLNLYGRKTVKRKDPKLKVGQHVRITKHKDFFEKGYESSWSEEIFQITNVIGLPQPMYKLNDMNEDPIDGYFYEHELQRVTVKPNRTFKVDKILDTKGRGVSLKYFVKWYGYGDSFNSWIPASDIQSLT